MAEYIEREALMDKFSARSPLLAQIRAYIATEPAADVAPVVHGKWNTLTECANEGVYCSVCHKKVYRADYAWCAKRNKVRSNYCPNCGARMDGDSDEG